MPLSASATILQDRDIIRIFNQHKVTNALNVTIQGAVTFSGEYMYLRNMAVSDVLLLAQPTPFASLKNVEITRFLPGTSGKTVYVDVKKNGSFKLKPGDKINVKKDNLRDQTCTITLSGEFVYPGTYRVKKGTRLSDIIELAGGFASSAYLFGAVFTRQEVKTYDALGQERVLEDEKRRLIYDQSHLGNLSMDTGTSLTVMMSARREALKYLEKQTNQYSGRVVIDIDQNQFDRSRDNFVIKDGDHLMVPTQPESIHLIGGVQQSISMAYHPSLSLHDYVHNVGGYTKYADVKNVYVFKASGRVFRNGKTINPGDIIYVPENVHISVNWIQLLTNITSIISNAVTSIALIKSIQ